MESHHLPDFDKIEEFYRQIGPATLHLGQKAAVIGASRNASGA
jgi:hypothetical protein